ncbi:hypothetical protein Dsin_012452 [Dipteronia sinensis]|uniref:RNA-directed DNA polymerase, eukaryota, reverse transcriptase zinc-binding domain protein n=1 Tax=Dipteronia sinensis TaxID=43782 RepID=A0AAE0E8H3_9ROSI|nr:hypothetical protein Dsin_012452 [Dipteronia sinensis]
MTSLWEVLVDTSNKFSALDEDGDYCNDDDSPSTASPDHSLWHSKIKNIDGVTIIGHSSPIESSSNNKRKKTGLLRKFRISFVYGSNDDRSRRAFCQSMCSSLHGSPWIVLGYFNVSRRVDESIEDCSRISDAMEEFNDCLQYLELYDLRFLGFLHTWCNKRSNGCISNKLDRVVVNNDWLVKFQNSKAIFLPPSFEAKDALDECQRLLDLQPLDSNLRIWENDLISYYTSTLKAAEHLLRKKSRIQWRKASERNSAYFFKAINGKRNKNKIHFITGDNGSLIEGYIRVKNEAIRHFQTILACSMPARHGIGSTLSNIIDNVISNDQADFMGRDVTNDQIREVCFSLHCNKAPGPDGFNAQFFKITWDIVGEDVISAVQEFFRSVVCSRNLMPRFLLWSLQSLILLRLRTFRPISCCNTLYKIIAKIIANRIKPCLLDIISPSQLSLWLVGVLVTTYFLCKSL